MFQDRFKSEPVEDDGYFLTVIRYIHQNPVKAKICNKTEDYPYSSMREYLSFPFLVDTGFVLGMISKEQFLDYHAEENNDNCLEVEDRFRLADEEAKAIIVKLSKCKSAGEFQLLDSKTRNALIHMLHKKGLSIRQISRLTGLSKKVVERNVGG